MLALVSLALCALAAEPLKIPENLPQPRVVDARLAIECLVAEPDLVTPTGIAVDEKGRVLVIECHTHFPPKDYAGPKHDRIRRFEDTDGDGKLDKVSTFFEGTHATMNLAIARDGSVFVATRSEIFRLWDRDDDGVAETRVPICRLETAGNYPHNGLSGFAFDFDGNVYFGMGENLGAAYKLVGADPAETISGGGEGGNIFCCDPEGKKLRRVATGFWNPFHLAFDAFGQLFTVDNDPDGRPPCRLLHVVEGGDYGFKFRHGRKGVHPFTAWNGELPGTLPMVCGTGEAPCAVLPYESDHLPADYVGDLLVTSWGDHRIERYKLEQRASFVSTMKPVVIGGDQFRPVGLALAPDGSLYLSDWVDKSYPVHGKGRIWRLSCPTATKKTRAKEPWAILESRHGPTREKAIDAILEREPNAIVNNELLWKVKVPKARTLKLPTDSPSTRSHMARVVIRGFGLRANRRSILADETDPRVWAAVVQDTHGILGEIEAIPGIRRDGLDIKSGDADLLVLAAAVRARRAQIQFTEAESADPFIFQAALFANQKGGTWAQLAGPGAHLANALSNKAPDIDKLLDDSDPRIRFVGVKLIGENRLKEYRDALDASFKSRPAGKDLFAAYLAAIEMLESGQDNKPDRAVDEVLLARLNDKNTPPAMRAFLLRMVSPSFEPLKTMALTAFAAEGDKELRIEAVRTLRERAGPERDAALARIAADGQLDANLRAEAAMGLKFEEKSHEALLQSLAEKAPTPVAIEALRNLAGQDPKAAPLWLKRNDDPADREALVTELWQRATGKYTDPHWDERLAADLLGTAGDPAAGERVFFHPRIATCSRCHQHSGRGGQVGPDLTNLAGAMTRERILHSIVAPNREIAPQYTPWIVTLADGRQITGLLASEELNGDQNYVDIAGKRHRVKVEEIESRKPSPNSLMPEGLRGQMTKEELRDLLAFLSLGAKKG